MRHLYCFLVFAVASGAIYADEHATATADFARLVRAEFNGDRALVTVAFMDQHIRWPGNSGFNASIDHVQDELEAAGFVNERLAGNSDRLVYRIEAYAMEFPSWEPLVASVHIAGEADPVLELSSNRNMLVRRSHGTPDDGVTAELVYAGSGSEAELDGAAIRGRIVMVDWNNAPLFQLVEDAIGERGAVGVLAYDMPHYTRPEINRDSIQFRGIRPEVSAEGAWAISLSFDARERLLAALESGPVKLNVKASVRWDPLAVERTVVAEVQGRAKPDERLVFSAHVQEPGANDNASGVAAQLEMARVAAHLLRSGSIDPGRTMTFLWGDEIVSTHRYVSQNNARAEGIRWGISLDMVGQDTTKTGGTFLIEKIPDPSAIWTRGDDQFSEWGGEPLTKKDMMPHYLNDLVLARAHEQATTNGWVVRTNPFEGGSDHVPFLQAGIPSLLLWHFTDQFYHTDRDRLDKVSATTLQNTGVTALVTGLALTSADADLAQGLINEVTVAAMNRIAAETALSIEAIRGGADAVEQRDIIVTWADWYEKALDATVDIEVGGSSNETTAAISAAKKELRVEVNKSLARIENVNAR